MAPVGARSRVRTLILVVLLNPVVVLLAQSANLAGTEKSSGCQMNYCGTHENNYMQRPPVRICATFSLHRRLCVLRPLGRSIVSAVVRCAGQIVGRLIGPANLVHCCPQTNTTVDLEYRGRLQIICNVPRAGLSRSRSHARGSSGSGTESRNRLAGRLESWPELELSAECLWCRGRDLEIVYRADDDRIRCDVSSFGDLQMNFLRRSRRLVRGGGGVAAQPCTRQTINDRRCKVAPMLRPSPRWTREKSFSGAGVQTNGKTTNHAS